MNPADGPDPTDPGPLEAEEFRLPCGCYAIEERVGKATIVAEAFLCNHRNHHSGAVVDDPGKKPR